MNDRLTRLWIPPSHLGEHGSKFWTRTGRILIDKGILSPVDRESFTALCSAYDTMVKAKIQMDRDGLTVETSRNDVKKSPVFSVWKVAVDQFNLLSKEFGLTPASRSKIKIEDPPEKDNGARKFFKLER